MRKIIVACAGAGALALTLGVAGTAAASSHPAPRPNTIGCSVAGANPFCFDIYNTQLGSGDVLKATAQVAGAKVILGARNGASGNEDFEYIPEGTVQSVLNGNPINWPFDDPNADEFFISTGDTQVFSMEANPNGHLKQLYLGVHSGGADLSGPGVYNSTATGTYGDRLWVASPFFQLDGSSPVINVGATNSSGEYKVAAIPNGGLAGVQPRLQTGELDSLGQAPENQTWGTEPNYP